MQPQGQCLLKMGLHNTYNEHIAIKKGEQTCFGRNWTPSVSWKIRPGPPSGVSELMRHSLIPTYLPGLRPLQELARKKRAYLDLNKFGFDNQQFRNLNM